MQKILIALGVLLLMAGLLWPWLGTIPFGRLPGDLVIEREHFTLYVPITTMILISAFLTLLFWLFR